MNTAYLLLGSNLEDRKSRIRQAIVEIGERIGDVRQSSSLYESEPWGFHSECNFLNQVIKVETVLSPRSLLGKILDIEQEMGRKRTGNTRGYSSRTIDIDILFFNDEVIRDERLHIPHPRISERMFTLVPLCELNASFIHPVFQKTLQDLLAECTDRNTVVPFTS